MKDEEHTSGTFADSGQDADQPYEVDEEKVWPGFPYGIRSA